MHRYRDSSGDRGLCTSTDRIETVEGIQLKGWNVMGWDGMGWDGKRMERGWKVDGKWME